LVIYAIHLYKQHQALAAAATAAKTAQADASGAQAELDTANDALSSIVPVLDSANENADEAQQGFLEANVFTPLKAAMTPEARQLIKDTRAAA
jgi:hypothetical protein